MRIDTADLLERFLRYVQIDTRSDPHSQTTPSTPGQWDLLRLLAAELTGLGATEVKVAEHGYVLATVPATSPKAKVPRVALCAHVDTAPNLPSAAKPIVHRAYDGKPIVLPDDPTKVLSVETMPHLRGAIGDDVITASGTSLLGADDKSGVAIVMATVRHLLSHPEIVHGPLRVCFSPDEEIASGMSKLDLADLAADVGYTLDGELRGGVDFETFSADGATLEITGVAAHPGWAKGVMVNALRLAGKFLDALPRTQSPESTSGRDGFIHPIECTGSAEHAVVRMIVRDFELAGLADKQALLERLAADLRVEEPRATITLRSHEQYRNMRYWLEKDMRPVEFAREALHRAGLAPISQDFRGGTDGSNLTARGLPTPNIFCGMHGIHSEREWVSLQDMEKSVETLVHLAQIWEERA
jgi:tripeptide aminopeptidase